MLSNKNQYIESIKKQLVYMIGNNEIISIHLTEHSTIRDMLAATPDETLIQLLEIYGTECKKSPLDCYNLLIDLTNNNLSNQITKVYYGSSQVYGFTEHDYTYNMIISGKPTIVLKLLANSMIMDISKIRLSSEKLKRFLLEKREEVNVDPWFFRIKENEYIIRSSYIAAKFIAEYIVSCVPEEYPIISISDNLKRYISRNIQSSTIDRVKEEIVILNYNLRILKELGFIERQITLSDLKEMLNDTKVTYIKDINGYMGILKLLIEQYIKDKSQLRFKWYNGEFKWCLIGEEKTIEIYTFLVKIS